MSDDLDPTPRALAEPFRFTPSSITPSFMDPNSSTFAAFVDQPAGIFTPTPGGSNSYGSLRSLSQPVNTSGIGLSLGTPLSLSAIAPPDRSDLQSFAPPQTIQPTAFQNFQFNPSADHQYLD